MMELAQPEPERSKSLLSLTGLARRVKEGLSSFILSRIQMTPEEAAICNKLAQDIEPVESIKKNLGLKTLR
jgi:hypothetical protein